MKENIFLGPQYPTGIVLVPVEIELVPRFGLLPSPSVESTYEKFSSAALRKSSTNTSCERAARTGISGSEVGSEKSYVDFFVRIASQRLFVLHELCIYTHTYI